MRATIVSRFIPTHVGNADPRRWWRPARPVHPHARGERSLSAQPRHASLGSSPRTWGTLLDDARPQPQRRFIPTHVGNASQVELPSANITVHPHARGERTSSSSGVQSPSGSSPRTWGTLDLAHAAVHGRRFIPTHVGNAVASCYAPAATYGSSPRTWGTLLSHLLRQFHVGSSPRTWGTQQFKKGSVVLSRFIPTHVGNASNIVAAHSATAVHPHARGERSISAVKGVFQGGSSPRTWGTPAPRRRRTCSSRFIPTHVGNAEPSGNGCPPRPVHPHARGERWPAATRSNAVGGSSVSVRPRPSGNRTTV